MRHEDSRRSCGIAKRALSLAEVRSDAAVQAWAGQWLAVCEQILALPREAYEHSLG